MAEEEFRQYRFRLPPGATDLILVRHGESAPARVDEPFPFVDGRADPPLDPVGEQEAERVADRLEHEDVAAIYATTLQRTQQTAAPLARRLGLEPRLESDLREVGLGEWEGGASFRKHVADWHPLAQRMFDEERWDVIPGAEPTEEFEGRVRAAIERIAAAHVDQRVVVVTHGGVIGVIVALASGARRFAFTGADNASLTHLVVLPPDAERRHAGGGRRWIVRRFNDTGHLGTDLDRPTQPLT